MYRKITTLLTIKCYLYKNGEKIIVLVLNVDPPPLRNSIFYIKQLVQSIKHNTFKKVIKEK